MDKWKEIFAALTENIAEDVVAASDVLSDIAVELVKYRVEHGLDQKDMAELLNVSQPMISKYESGTYNFTIKTLYAVARKIGLNVDFNIYGNNQSKLDNSNSIISSNSKKSKLNYDCFFDANKNKGNSANVIEYIGRIA